MKRTIAMCGLLLAGFFAGALWIGIPVGAGGQGEPTQRPSSGDTNADGFVDMSDAVYLLTYLFQGGEPPAACAQDADLVERVANIEDGFLALVATLDEKLERIAVATGANGDRLDGIARGVGTPCEERVDRFVDNEDGTVTDSCSGLMWSDTSVEIGGNGVINNLDRVEWGEALALAEELDLAGHSDWRIPSVSELRTIYGETTWFNLVGPTLHLESRYHWTSTSSKTHSDDAWAFHFTHYG